MWLVVVVLLGAGLAVLPLALVANGFTMVRRERRSLGNLLSLVLGLGMLALPAVSLALVRADDAVGSAITVALVLGIAWAAFCFLGFLAQTWLYRRTVRRVAAHAVVVLGSRVVMGRWLVDAGFPADLVLVEDRARTTRENLRNSVDLLHAHDVPGPYLVATNDYHAPRAAMEAMDLGLDVHAVGGPTARYYRPSAYLREFVAVARRSRGVHVVAAGGILVVAGLVLVAGLGGA